MVDGKINERNVIFIKDAETLKVINELAEKIGFHPNEVVKIALRKFAKHKGIEFRYPARKSKSILIRDSFYAELADKLKEKTNLKSRIDVVRIALTHLQETLGNDSEE